MSRFTTRGIPDPEGVASGGDPELTCIDAAHGSSGFLKNARSWIRDTQTRIRERLEIFTSSRGMAGAGLAAQTRFQTSFGAFPEGSALEKINLRLKSLENDWIEAEKAYHSTQKIWNDLWDKIKQLQKRRDLAGDEKEKSEQTMLIKSEEVVLGSFDLLLERVQDLRSRLEALLTSARP